MLASMASETPIFKDEMVPWLLLRLRRSKAGGMHLTYFMYLKPGKDLKCRAACLTGNGAPGFQQAYHFT
jgi:hypothetical protein